MEGLRVHLSPRWPTVLSQLSLHRPRLSETVTMVLGRLQVPARATQGGGPRAGDGAQPVEKVWQGTGSQLGLPLKLGLLDETVFPLEFAMSHERWPGKRIYPKTSFHLSLKQSNFCCPNERS